MDFTRTSTGECKFEPPASSPPTFEAHVRLPNSTILRITDQSRGAKFQPPDDLEEYSPELLKSALQKAVRRKWTEAAVSLASHLVSQNPTAILRRLPIIILEDSILHPLYPNLVWIMIAYSKGYKLRVDDVHLILQIVVDICEYVYHDHLFLDEPPIPPDPEDPILRSVLLRTYYGGMPGDMRFLRHAIHIWEQRLKDPLWKTRLCPRSSFSISTAISNRLHHLRRE